MKKVALILTALALSVSANSFTSTQKLKVSHSKPVYKNIQKKIPYTQCWDEEVPTRNHNYRSNNPIGTLIGGVAGGILGNQVGKGRGKTVATIGGALIGSMVGHNLSNQKRRHNNSYSTQIERRCTTQYEITHTRELIGYENIAYFNGQKIVKITPNQKRYIKVRKTIHY